MSKDVGSKLIPSLVEPKNPVTKNPQYYVDPRRGGKPTTGDTVRMAAYYEQAILHEPVREYSIVTTGKNFNIPRNSGNQIVFTKVYPIISALNTTNQGLDQTGKPNAGNFGGDSRDIKTLTGFMPTIPEDGGPVNRTGTMRDSLKANTVDMGIYMQQTFKTLDVDPDNVNNRLQAAFDQELYRAVVELHAKSLLIDLLLAAGTVRYAGTASSLEEINGDDEDTGSFITYRTLKGLSTALQNKNAKFTTKMVTGVALTDTKTIGQCYLAYASTEVINILEDIKDNLGNPAWIPVEKYAAGAGSTFENEVGKIGDFRVIRMKNMLMHEGVGADETDNTTGATATNGKYDAHPFLVVPEDTFGQVSILYDSLKGDTKTLSNGSKIVVKQSKLGEVTDSDPFGRTFTKSAQWVYGFLAIYAERIGVIWTAGVA